MLLSLKEALKDPERQYAEFKQSTAETNDAAKALVGFANSRGGQVFFGVTDAREAVGIDLGPKIIEDLIDKLEMHIYPSLPLEVEEFPGKDGKKVVRVWTPADKPPVVGGYIYTSRQLNLDDRMIIDRKSQAFRRVGRQTRKVNFMWLRGTLPSDPLVMIDAESSGGIQEGDFDLTWLLWHASGGVAFDLAVTTDPVLGPAVDAIKDVPGSETRHASGHLRLSELDTFLPLADDEETVSGQFWLVARYRDDWGCEWESRRRIDVHRAHRRKTTWTPGRTKVQITLPMPLSVFVKSTPEFSRRIVSLPPKRLASPE